MRSGPAASQPLCREGEAAIQSDPWNAVEHQPNLLDVDDPPPDVVDRPQVSAQHLQRTSDGLSAATSSLMKISLPVPTLRTSPSARGLTAARSVASAASSGRWPWRAGATCSLGRSTHPAVARRSGGRRPTSPA